MTATQTKLFIIAAPSGTGKTSLVEALINDQPHLAVSVSHTTREQRQGEIDGNHYHFISKPMFEKMLADQTFLEHANVYGNLYGTSRHWVESELSKGTSVILEIDWQGARQIRQSFADTVSIFILPPSRAALETRLNARQQDAPETIQRRLQAMREEVSHADEFDYVMVNDSFEQALAELKSIVQGQPSKACQALQHHGLIKELLG